MRNHLLAVALCGITACASDPAPADDPTVEPDLADQAQAARLRPHHYVTSTLELPTTAARALALGFDLDGDGKADNLIGTELAAFSAQLDLAGYAQSALTQGWIVILHSLHTAGLIRSRSANWEVYIGNPQSSPDLTSGHGSFSIASDSPRNLTAGGSVAHRAFAGGADSIAIAIPLFTGQPPLTVHLVAAHLAADVSAAGCSNGRVGGAVPMTDVDEVILPAVAAVLDYQLVSDGCSASPAACSSTDSLLLGLLDQNGDRRISADELRSSPLVQSLIQPDVDVLGADGKPGHDGVKDAISIAVGFTCTAAQFSE
jgi:hypothetical protein